MDSWGMELSKKINVRKNDSICLTKFPREVQLIDA